MDVVSLELVQSKHFKKYLKFVTKAKNADTDEDYQKFLKKAVKRLKKADSEELKQDS